MSVVAFGLGLLSRRRTFQQVQPPPQSLAEYVSPLCKTSSPCSLGSAADPPGLGLGVWRGRESCVQATNEDRLKPSIGAVTERNPNVQRSRQPRGCGRNTAVRSPVGERVGEMWCGGARSTCGAGPFRWRSAQSTAGQPLEDVTLAWGTLCWGQHCAAVSSNGAPLHGTGSGLWGAPKSVPQTHATVL